MFEISLFLKALINFLLLFGYQGYKPKQSLDFIFKGTLG